MGSVIQHGDCRDVIPTLALGSVNCIIADPPYGVDFRSRRAETPGGKRWVRDVENDKDLAGALALFDEVFRMLAEKCAPEADAYVFTRWDIVGHWIDLVNSFSDIGWKYKMLLVWDKGIPGMGDIDSNWGCGHELILYLKKGRREVPYRRSAIIAVDKVPNMKHIHPTEKPVKLLERLIEMSTDPGDLVVDPFSGSGSTVVAAQNVGREGLGIESDAQYIEPSRARLGYATLFS